MNGLKDLVLKNMLGDDRRITMGELVAAPKERVYVSMDAGAVNRNGWNGLDPDLLHDVFTRLNLKDKVKCVSRVCKAWNEMKERPGLFEDLTDEGGPSVTDMYGFLRWLPNETTSLVTRIRLDSSLSEKYCADVLFNISYARQQINPTLSDCESLQSMEEIILFGTNTEGLNLGRLLSMGVGPKFRSLTIDGISKPNSAIDIWRIDPGSKRGSLYYLTDLLRNSDRMEILKMPAFLLSPHGLCRSLSVIGPSGVTQTSLKVLDLTMTISDGTRENEVRIDLY